MSVVVRISVSCLVVVGLVYSSPLPDRPEILRNLDDMGCNFPPINLINATVDSCATKNMDQLYSANSPSWAFVWKVCETIYSISREVCTAQSITFELLTGNPSDLCGVGDMSDTDVAKSDLEFVTSSSACSYVCPYEKYLCQLLLGLARAKKTLPKSPESIWREKYEKFQQFLTENNCTFPPRSNEIEKDIQDTCHNPPAASSESKFQENLCTTLFSVSQRACRLPRLDETDVAEMTNSSSMDVCKLVKDLASVSFVRLPDFGFMVKDDQACPFVCKDKRESARVCRLLYVAVTRPFYAHLENLQDDAKTDTTPQPAETEEQPDGNGDDDTDSETDTPPPPEENDNEGAEAEKATDTSSSQSTEAPRALASLPSSVSSMSSARIVVYLVVILCAVVLLYVLFMYKHTLINCVLASRESRQRRPSSSEAQYSQLQPSMEEVMPSLKKAAVPKTHAY